MRYKTGIFIVCSVTNLILAGYRFGSRGFLLSAGVLAVIASLLWSGYIWNSMFPPGVASAEHPVVTRETPDAVLAFAGWVLLIVLTLLLI